MNPRLLFRNEAAAALLLVECAEALAVEGLIPQEKVVALRRQFEDAQNPRPNDPPVPHFYER
jgi:hypothetical protein